MNASGKRMWEVITEPYFAKSEDGAKDRDVNLFSLCGIKITAGNGKENPAHLVIDFSRMQIPAFIKIPRDEIISNLLMCIINCTEYAQREKPVITVVGKPEDGDLMAQVMAQYQIASLGNTEFDFNKPYHSTVKHPTLAEQLDLVPTNIVSNTLLADIPYNADEKIIIRELRVKPYTAPHDRHYYRFEFYSSGVLQNCDTWWDMSDPGKVVGIWSGPTKCNISLMDSWLAVEFDRDNTPHWTFGRRVD